MEICQILKELWHYVPIGTLWGGYKFISVSAFDLIYMYFAQHKY